MLRARATRCRGRILSGIVPDAGSHRRDQSLVRQSSRLIVTLLQRYFPTADNFLELGCGAGSVLVAIRRSKPRLLLVGSELHPCGLQIARNRLGPALFVQLDARRIPTRSEFDVIGGFDVIEHINEDGTVLAQIHSALQPFGGLIITVPPHPSLWSETDDAAHHVRHYERGEVERKLGKAASDFRLPNFTQTSYTSLLLPVMVLGRLLRRGGSPFVALQVSSWLNQALSSVVGLEIGLPGAALIGRGSRVIVAQRL
jgi:SAM-dependent methyltransferase